MLPENIISEKALSDHIIGFLVQDQKRRFLISYFNSVIGRFRCVQIFLYTDFPPDWAMLRRSS